MNKYNRALLVPLLFGALASASAAYAAAAPVHLGTAGNFVILSKSGITDVPSSAITGNIGTSPITGAADHVTCTEVTGKVYSVDAAGPAPCSIKASVALTTAIGDMQTAYRDAAGRTARVTELGAGQIGGRTIAPGIYKWSSSVAILKNVTLGGDANSVWIFQIAQNLSIAAATSVVLKNGARPQNVFWQVAGKTTLETTAHLEGIVLCKTLISVKTGASVKGRLYAQTAVTLQKNVVTQP